MKKSGWRTARGLLVLATLAGVATPGVAAPAPRSLIASGKNLLPIALSDDLLLVFAQPKPGASASAFATWYSHHLDEFVTIPGVKGAQRFAVEGAGRVGKGLPGSLAMYDISAAGMTNLDTEVARRMKDGRITHSDVVDYDGIVRMSFRPLGVETRASDVAGTDPTPMGTGPVGYHYLIVISDPAKPDQEDAFNSWYDHMHVPDVLHVPGFVSAQRFIRIGGASDVPRYLVIFTFRSGDIAATNAEIGRRIREKITRMSPAFGGDKAIGAIATPLGLPVHTR